MSDLRSDDSSGTQTPLAMEDLAEVRGSLVTVLRSRAAAPQSTEDSPGVENMALWPARFWWGVSFTWLIVMAVFDSKYVSQVIDYWDGWSNWGRHWGQLLVWHLLGVCLVLLGGTITYYLVCRLLRVLRNEATVARSESLFWFGIAIVLMALVALLSWAATRWMDDGHLRIVQGPYFPLLALLALLRGLSVAIFRRKNTVYGILLYAITLATVAYLGWFISTHGGAH
ncbi:MAG: hypothetical protein WCO56_27005 [Verrucomicrobiota bacterium]